MFGREGMSDMVFVAGVDRAALRVIVQNAGEALCLPVREFVSLCETSPMFMKLMSRYQQASLVQCAYTALSHGNYVITERLARWLLMTQDRIGDDIPLVHDYLSMSLAVRRSGITEAMHVLEGKGAVRSTRGQVRILERNLLLQLSGGSYGVPEEEYERSLGPMLLSNVPPRSKMHSDSA